MTKVARLYEQQHRSPWLENLTRRYLREGIRAGTGYPAIFAMAIEG
jgi:hypothetical protein